MIPFKNLPRDYLAFLDECRNGLLLYHGYYKVFGIESPGPYSLAQWNSPECWRFAWPHIPENVLFIGSSVFGDQYGLDVTSGAVFFFDGFEMETSELSDSFTDFQRTELNRVSDNPYDSRVQDAFRQFGELTWSDGIALVPPLLLVDDEGDAEFHRTNLRSLMIANGDVYSQLKSPEDESRSVLGVETFVDEMGRVRLRLRFS